MTSPHLPIYCITSSIQISQSTNITSIQVVLKIVDLVEKDRRILSWLTMQCISHVSNWSYLGLSDFYFPFLVSLWLKNILHRFQRWLCRYSGISHWKTVLPKLTDGQVIDPLSINFLWEFCCENKLNWRWDPCNSFYCQLHFIN